jgi:spoIIIJ-associated protein
MSSSDSIEASAATIDQAIGQALAQLGAEQDDVTIEVLSTPRSGVLGIGARPARVRVTRRVPAGARSGVMSPPPAPPLRPTPPEMRRPEARPEARVPPLHPERSTPPVREPVALQEDDAPEPPREAPRESREPAPQSRRERSDPPGEARSDEPRQRPRGPARGPARQQRSDDASGNERIEEAQARDRVETSSDARETGNDRTDQRENGPAGGRPRRGRRRGRGRTGGSASGPTVASGGSADRVEGSEPRPTETQPRAAALHDYEPRRDEDSDPFASVDEAGNDPRQIADLREQAREATIFLQRILELMGEQAAIEPAESDDPETLELNIKGDGSGILIGRHGQTLDAIEYMVNRLLARKIKDAAPISIDTESYRARRRRLLQHMALSKGEQAKREHVAVMVEPMPPRDRRIVHLALKDDPMIATRSTGDGFMRAIEIVPVVERHDPNERGSENRGRGRTREPDRDKAALGEQGGFKHGQKRIV